MRKILVAPLTLLDGKTTNGLLKRESIRVFGSEPRAVAVLEKALEKRPDLIVFSSELAGMSVALFCREIKTNEALSHVRLLMLVERLDVGAVHTAIRDLDGSLLCPVEDEQLVETIAALLDVDVREGPRIPVDILAWIEDLCETSECPATVVNVVNLSQRGMLVESPVRLQVGERGSFRFFLPDQSGMVAGSCRVHLVTDEVLLHYGIELQEMSLESRQRLRLFVERRGAR